MCFQSAAERLVEEQPSAKTSNNTSGSSAAADEWDDPKFQSDDFKIYEWKVTLCTNTEAHDTDKCPFAHPGEKGTRRDVRVYKYSPEACPATQQKNGKCPRGMDCPLSHTVFERWLHPQRFRTQLCTNGADCPRKSTCFFAHRAAYGHGNTHSSHSNSHLSALGLAGSGGSHDEQALLAMLLSQMHSGNANAAAQGVAGGLHGMGVNPHFQAAANPCASQAQAAASALLAAAAAAQMAPAAGGLAGAGLTSFTDASLGASMAMQAQGGCHSFFMH
ncbi:hypothetical protein OEZ86_001851 [Tetradesmus obliquus]|nr:hypothetical protein OEZ86_001851 [Tetradesmus obliquus]